MPELAAWLKRDAGRPRRGGLANGPVIPKVSADDRPLPRRRPCVGRWRRRSRRRGRSPRKARPTRCGVWRWLRRRAPGDLRAGTARALRRRLRAHARTLGDLAAADGTHEVLHLVEATGYAQWHRRLFARFLAERGLLRHPEHGSVSLEDCEELAPREGFSPTPRQRPRAMARGCCQGCSIPTTLCSPWNSRRSTPGPCGKTWWRGSTPRSSRGRRLSLGWTYQFWRAAGEGSGQQGWRARSGRRSCPR